MNVSDVSILHMQVLLYTSQQHNGYSTELMRTPFSNRNTQQHSFKCNSQQKYHAQLFVDAVYHMNDMWMICYKDTTYRQLYSMPYSQNVGVELNLAVGKINFVLPNFIPLTFNTCI